MTVKFPLSDFFQSSGNAAAQFSEDLRDSVVGFACNVWANYPGYITQGTNPLSSFARGFMNSACSPMQPAVPAPSVPFTGGQCTELYNVTTSYEQSNLTTCAPFTFDNNQFNLMGPITGLRLQFLVFIPADPPNILFDATRYEVFLGYNGGASEVQLNDYIDDGCGNPDSVSITNIVRSDGMPDNCGDPPVAYPGPPPSSNDLTTIVNITNGDTVDNSYTVVFNKTQTNYNFPMSFKINGVNATLDLGGLTLFGDVNVTTTTTGNDSLPPGSDGGEDGVGGNNDTVYDDTEYPTLPDLVTPETTLQAFNYLRCNTDVLDPIMTTIKVASSSIPWLNLLIEIILDVLNDTCGGGETEALVGLPDYYGLQPGVDRPAIVYLWKEVISGVIQPSTYSSTVQYPSAASIANIDTVIVPDRNLGTYIVQATLTDGSRIRSTGDTEANAISNYDFLLNQVDSGFVPTDIADRRVISRDMRLMVKTVKCRQIEYYPMGKNANTSPAQKRVIDIN